MLTVTFVSCSLISLLIMIYTCIISTAEPPATYEARRHQSSGRNVCACTASYTVNTTRECLQPTMLLANNLRHSLKLLKVCVPGQRSRQVQARAPCLKIVGLPEAASASTPAAGRARDTCSTTQEAPSAGAPATVKRAISAAPHRRHRIAGAPAQAGPKARCRQLYTGEASTLQSIRARKLHFPLKYASEAPPCTEGSLCPYLHTACRWGFTLSFANEASALHCACA